MSVVPAPIVRAFRVEGLGHGRWSIAFRLVPPRADVVIAVEAVRAGLRVANAAVRAQTLIGLGAIRQGKNVLIPMYGDGKSVDAVSPWLDALAHELRAAGHSGILQRTRARSRYQDPPYIEPGPNKELAPVAYITFRHHDADAIGEAALEGCALPVEVRESLAAFASSWPQMRRGRSWLLWEEVSSLEPDQISAAMLAVTAGVGGGLIYDAEEPLGQRNITTWVRGELVVSSWTVESVGDWQGWVEEVTAALRLAPVHVQQAFIRNSFPGSTSHTDLDQPFYPEQLRLVRSARMLSFYPELAEEWVCDANGRQILNAHQVERIRNLDRNWDVEELATDRYLVSAKDMYPWFGIDITPLEVLHRARRDFLDIILTWDAAVAVNPDLETSLPYAHTRDELMRPIDISLA